MDTGGRPIYVLDQVAERYPIALHGVSMSIGSTDPLDRDYLAQAEGAGDANARALGLRSPLLDGRLGRNTHDLLPDALHRGGAAPHRRRRVREVQDILERPLVLENPSSLRGVRRLDHDRVGVPGALAEDADCGLLLDVNNVYVSSFNHGFDPNDYVDAHPRRPRRAVPPRRAHEPRHAHPRHAQRPRDRRGVGALPAGLRAHGRDVDALEWDEDIPELRGRPRRSPEGTAPSGDPRRSPCLSCASRASRSGCRRSSCTRRVSRKPSIPRKPRPCSGKSVFPRSSSPRRPSPPWSGSASTTGCISCGWRRLSSPISRRSSTSSGAVAFRRLVERYVQSFPSRSFSLNHLSDHLPEYIKRARWLARQGVLLRPRSPGARHHPGL